MDFTRPTWPAQAALLMDCRKFIGQPLSEMPDEYLLALFWLDNLREPLLSAVLHEMDRRLAAEQLNQGSTAVEPLYQPDRKGFA